MHDGKEIKIRVERNTSSYWKWQLQWIWNDDSDWFKNFKGFPVTGNVNRCPIHYFKFSNQWIYWDMHEGK
jgi:hypothetical protein